MSLAMALCTSRYTLPLIVFNSISRYAEPLLGYEFYDHVMLSQALDALPSTMYGLAASTRETQGSISWPENSDPWADTAMRPILLEVQRLLQEIPWWHQYVSFPMLRRVSPHETIA